MSTLLMTNCVDVRMNNCSIMVADPFSKGVLELCPNSMGLSMECMAMDLSLHPDEEQLKVFKQQLSEVEERGKFVYDTCLTIINLWRRCTELPPRLDLTERLIQLTIQCVLSGGWMKVSDQIILEFIQCLTLMENVCGCDITFSKIVKMCGSLKYIVQHGVWDVPYLQPIFDSDCSRDLVNQLWEIEDSSFIKARIEKLCLAGEHENARALARAGIRKNENFDDLANFGQLSIDYLVPTAETEEYFQFGAIFAILTYKLDIGNEGVEEWCSVLSLFKVVDRLMLHQDSSRIAPKWKKGWKKSEEVAQYCLERNLMAMVKTVFPSCLLPIFQGVFEGWLKVTQGLNSKRDDETLKASGRIQRYNICPSVCEQLQEDHVKLLNTIPIETIDNVSKLAANLDYLYVFANCLFQFGNGPGIRSKCVEWFLTALLHDANEIESLQTRDYDKENLIEKQKQLSKRYLELSKFFQDDYALYFDIVLTSYSLNPSENLFEELKELAQKRSEVEIDKLNLMEKIEKSEIEINTSILNSSIVWEVASPSKKSSELGIPEASVDALLTAINNSRLSCFNTIQPCWTFYEPLCVKHLRTRGRDIKDSNNLELARPDYSKYEGLPPIEEENEMPFEVGFEPRRADVEAFKTEEKLFLTKEPSSRLRSWKSGISSMKLGRMMNRHGEAKRIRTSVANKKFRKPKVKEEYTKPQHDFKYISDSFMDCEIFVQNSIRTIMPPKLHDEQLTSVALNYSDSSLNRKRKIAPSEAARPPPRRARKPVNYFSSAEDDPECPVSESNLLNHEVFPKRSKIHQGVGSTDLTANLHASPSESPAFSSKNVSSHVEELYSRAFVYEIPIQLVPMFSNLKPKYEKYMEDKSPINILECVSSTPPNKIKIEQINSETAAEERELMDTASKGEPCPTPSTNSYEAVVNPGSINEEKANLLDNHKESQVHDVKHEVTLPDSMLRIEPCFNDSINDASLRSHNNPSSKHDETTDSSKIPPEVQRKMESNLETDLSNENCNSSEDSFIPEQKKNESLIVCLSSVEPPAKKTKMEQIEPAVIVEGAETLAKARPPNIDKAKSQESIVNSVPPLFTYIFSQGDGKQSHNHDDQVHFAGSAGESVAIKRSNDEDSLLLQGNQCRKQGNEINASKAKADDQQHTTESNLQANVPAPCSSLNKSDTNSSKDSSTTDCQKKKPPAGFPTYSYRSLILRKPIKQSELVGCVEQLGVVANPEDESNSNAIKNSQENMDNNKACNDLEASVPSHHHESKSCQLANGKSELTIVESSMASYSMEDSKKGSILTQNNQNHEHDEKNNFSCTQTEDHQTTLCSADDKINDSPEHKEAICKDLEVEIVSAQPSSPKECRKDSPIKIVEEMEIADEVEPIPNPITNSQEKVINLTNEKEIGTPIFPHSSNDNSKESEVGDDKQVLADSASNSVLTTDSTTEDASLPIDKTELSEQDEKAKSLITLDEEHYNTQPNLEADVSLCTSEDLSNNNTEESYTLASFDERPTVICRAIPYGGIIPIDKLNQEDFKPSADFDPLEVESQFESFDEELLQPSTDPLSSPIQVDLTSEEEEMTEINIDEQGSCSAELKERKEGFSQRGVHPVLIQLKQNEETTVSTNFSVNDFEDTMPTVRKRKSSFASPSGTSSCSSSSSDSEKSNLRLVQNNKHYEIAKVEVYDNNFRMTRKSLRSESRLQNVACKLTEIRTKNMKLNGQQSRSELKEYCDVNLNCESFKGEYVTRSKSAKNSHPISRRLNSNGRSNNNFNKSMTQCSSSPTKSISRSILHGTARIKIERIDEPNNDEGNDTQFIPSHHPNGKSRNISIDSTTSEVCPKLEPVSEDEYMGHISTTDDGCDLPPPIIECYSP